MGTHIHRKNRAMKMKPICIIVIIMIIFNDEGDRQRRDPNWYTAIYECMWEMAKKKWANSLYIQTHTHTHYVHDVYARIQTDSRTLISGEQASKCDVSFCYLVLFCFVFLIPLQWIVMYSSYSFFPSSFILKWEKRKE